MNTLDPVTQHHVNRPPRARRRVYGGLLEGDNRALHRRVARPAGRCEDQRLCARARPSLRARAAESSRSSRGNDRERAPRGLVRLRPERRALADGRRAHRSPGEGKVHVRSAGSDPADEINPAVVEAMAELGIDLEEFPKPLTDEVVSAADAVITMGCGDACPIYPGKRYLDWELADPAGRSRDRAGGPRRHRRPRPGPPRRAVPDES